MGFKGSEVQILSSRPTMKYPGGSTKVGPPFIENRPEADVAQSVERVLGKDEVGSSILLVSSIYQIANSIIGDFIFHCSLFYC